VGDPAVTSALVQRAQEAVRAADAERRRLERLCERLRSLEAVHGMLARAAREPGPVLVRVQVPSGGADLPKDLTVRALSALAEVVSGEVAAILAELEVGRV
jgi:hypothetical protein